MKTKEQILKWLDEQPWKGEFYEAVFTLRADLNLDYDEAFIFGAFGWGRTEQGRDVWSTRDSAYRKWYFFDERPMSWEEYCKQYPVKNGEHYYINGECDIVPLLPGGCRDANTDIHTMPKDLCEAFLAYMKLIQLRDAWVKDCDKTACCFKIKSQKGGITDGACPYFENGLSFPTLTMADEFMDTFKDLLEVAKPLL